MANEGQSRTARRQQKKSLKKGKFNWKRLAIILLIIGLTLFIGVASVFSYYIATAPELDVSKLSDPLSTKVYDKDGELIADLGVQKRTKIDYDDIPKVLEDAVIATEDARFFEHFGIDLRRIGAAVWANITQGFGAQGASTITQQVVKTEYLTFDKKIKRKVQEQWLAIKLEQDYSKEQILTMYLNKINYGGSIYGVSKAAEVYFNKSLDELTLSEAALLAGLPQSPNRYNPFQNPELAEKRRNTVLNLMVHHNKISQEEADEAKSVPVSSLIVGEYDQDIPYDAFIEQVLNEVDEKIEDIDVYNDGLEIYTTLDQEAQSYVEKLLSNESPIEYPDNEFQAGIVLLDTKSGAIRAIGGGRNKGDVNTSWNYAISGEGRQPGSTFKPIIDYGPAIEHLKWSTYHQLEDEPYHWSDAEGKLIRNWDDNYEGQMSIRTAIARSRNIPAVKTFQEVGSDNARAFAEGLGIGFDSGQIYESDSIGGGTLVTPLELAGAYSAFGNNGIYQEPYAVTEVKLINGKTIELESEAHTAMSDYTAYMITDMLKSVMTMPRATGTAYNIPGLPLAGKTGTTNDGADSWMAGYTTNYTLAVWTGYPSSSQTIENGRNISRILFKDIIAKVSEGMETKDFVKPNSVKEVAIERGTWPPLLPSDFTPQNEIIYELFVSGQEPKEKSQKFDQLDPIQGLTATYDEEKKSILLEWEYESEVTFPIEFLIRGGRKDQEMKDIGKVEQLGAEVKDVKPGETYILEVTVMNKDDNIMTSQPVSTEITIPEKDIIDDLLGDGDNDDGNSGNNNDGGTNNDGTGNDGTGDGGTNNDDTGNGGTDDGGTNNDGTGNGGAENGETGNGEGGSSDNDGDRRGRLGDFFR
ncbi:PBP1A family penicillin-binding protein [Bacillaceae bacterium S4-13-58]